MIRKSGGLTEFGFEAPKMPEANLPVNYSIPFKWGNIRVTDAAHEAYELAALVPGVHKGDLPEDAMLSRRRNRIDVRLIGPSEIPEGPFGATQGIFMDAHATDRGGLSINTGFRKTRSENIEEFTEMFLQLTGMEKEDLDEAVADEEGLLLSDFLDQRAPQMMIHLLSFAVGQMVETTQRDKLQAISEKKLVRSATLKGLGGVAIGAAVIGFGAPNTVNDVFGGVYGSLGVLMARGDIKSYFRDLPLRQTIINAESDVVARAVEKDFHDTYCTAHFDQMFEQNLQDN